MKRGLIVAALALAGCQTTEGFDKFASGFVGQSEAAIIGRFGVPDKTYEAGGTKYLAFTRSQTSYSPGVAPSYQSNVIGNTVYTTSVGGMAPSVYTANCTLNFQITKGVVSGYSFNGNGCVG
jgi:hypothetical protein